jgi:putative hydrolase of the HAD superfamily
MVKKAFFFDIDDTLIPTSDFIDDVLKQSVISMINAGLPEDNPQQAVRRLHQIRMHNKEEKSGNSFDLLCHAYGFHDKAIVLAGVDSYRKMKHAALQTNIQAKSTLDYLVQKGFSLGVITTGNPEKQWDKVEIIGLRDYFKDCFHASLEPEEVKPSPVLFQRALESLAADPSESYYIGNRLDVDIMGAHNAGLKAVLMICGKYAGQTPQSLLLKRGIKGSNIMNGKYDTEIKKMTPEHTIRYLREIKDIV